MIISNYKLIFYVFQIASYIDWLRCIQEEAATPAPNAAIDGDKTDQTHAQIEAKCKSKLPQKI